jgi:hypothetical protein
MRRDSLVIRGHRLPLLGSELKDRWPNLGLAEDCYLEILVRGRAVGALVMTPILSAPLVELKVLT